MPFRFLTVLSLCAFAAQATAQERPVLQTQERPTIQENSQTEEGAKKRGPRLVPAAKAFLASLSEEQQKLAQLDFETEKRVQWHFIPMETRKGMVIRDMNDEQKEAAHKLIRASISQIGYNKAKLIMKLEGVLLAMEGPKSEGKRDPEKYYVTIFGEPANKNRWGMSIEGHHLSLNFVMQGNQIEASTPQFFATNPSKLGEDYGEELTKGLQVLRAEEQLGFKLVRSLSPEQMKKATLPGDTPSEIRGAGSAQPPEEKLPGIAASELEAEQVETLKKLMRAYTGKMKPLVAKARWAKIDEAGFDNVTFSWSGAKRAGVGHYYVVQGPSFVIEFINVQPDPAGNPANHVRCVWRDANGDFGLSAK